LLSGFYRKKERYADFYPRDYTEEEACEDPNYIVDYIQVLAQTILKVSLSHLSILVFVRGTLGVIFMKSSMINVMKLFHYILLYEFCILGTFKFNLVRVELCV
jgi:hypothetical protein